MSSFRAFLQPICRSISFSPSGYEILLGFFPGLFNSGRGYTWRALNTTQAALEKLTFFIYKERLFLPVMG